ncbi:hypothetical protein SRHO_G00115510 [Serrasalmus rhombeus]
MVLVISIKVKGLRERLLECCRFVPRRTKTEMPACVPELLVHVLFLDRYLRLAGGQVSARGREELQSWKIETYSLDNSASHRPCPPGGREVERTSAGLSSPVIISELLNIRDAQSSYEQQRKFIRTVQDELLLDRRLDEPHVVLQLQLQVLPVTSVPRYCPPFSQRAHHSAPGRTQY